MTRKTELFYSLLYNLKSIQTLKSYYKRHFYWCLILIVFFSVLHFACLVSHLMSLYLSHTWMCEMLFPYPLGKHWTVFWRVQEQLCGLTTEETLDVWSMDTLGPIHNSFLVNITRTWIQTHNFFKSQDILTLHQCTPMNWLLEKLLGITAFCQLTIVLLKHEVMILRFLSRLPIKIIFSQFNLDAGLYLELVWIV